MMRHISLLLPLIAGAFGQNLAVSPSLLTFNAVQGGTAPPAQSLHLTLYAVGPILSVVSTLNDSQDKPIPIPSWLGGIPTSISTNADESATVSITVNPNSLVPGTYGVQIYFYSLAPACNGSPCAGDTANILLVVTSSSSPLPHIANVTNAALPTLDNPPVAPPEGLALPSRSMATIFGTNLADYVASSTSPWSNTLGGTEVHLADDTCFDSSCDLIAGLIYVSPMQINFLVPDNGATAPPSSCPVSTCGFETVTRYRIVFVRNGQRIDNQGYMLGGPGRLLIQFDSGPTFQVGSYGFGDYDVVFQMGYDCLFSYSLTDPGACGVSSSQGQNRVPLGAITDAVTGALISSQVPVHQGQLITLWMTGLYSGVTLNSKTGLMTANTTTSIGFGVAQLGQDKVSSLACPGPEPSSGCDVNSRIGSFMTPVPLWAGESPQVVGLDQVNVAFPTCASTPATTEKRYDAFLQYVHLDYNNNVHIDVRTYLPFVVRPGDPDCQW